MTKDLIKQFHLLQNKPFSKKLGQNFILDINILDKIISLSGSIKDENILEIGAGVGSLSQRILLQKPKKLIILEKDPACVQAVKSWIDVDIRECDALDVDFTTLFPKDKCKVIANLPYSVASEILVRFCHARHLIKDMTLMFQKEVGERIIAKSGIKDFGRLSVIAQTCFDCKIIKIFPPSIFIPAPKVESALVHFTPKQNVDIDLNKLSALTQQLFSKRRKMLRHSISEATLLKCNINPTERVENLKLDDFFALLKVLT